MSQHIVSKPIKSSDQRTFRTITMADTLLTPFEDGDDISFHICIEEGFILSASVCDSDISSWCTDDEENGSDVSSLSVDDEVCWLDEADDANDVVMHEERRIDITVDASETDDDDNVNNAFTSKVCRPEFHYYDYGNYFDKVR